MPSAGFESAIPAIEERQANASDHKATEIGAYNIQILN
jgi:hypothetical protein